MRGASAIKYIIAFKWTVGGLITKVQRAFYYLPNRPQETTPISACLCVVGEPTAGLPADIRFWCEPQSILKLLSYC